jgi:hypothetical protein
MFDIESILLNNLKKEKQDDITKVSKKAKPFGNWPQSKKPSNYSLKSLSEWNQRDFAVYMSQEYINNFGHIWDFNSSGVVTYLGRIKAQLRDFYGFCDNIVLKDYIDYFYKEWIAYCENCNIKFWIRFMMNNKPLSAFYSSYTYKITEEKTFLPEKKETPEKDFDNYYALSVEALVFNCGLIASVDYLLNKRKMDEKIVYDKISKIIITSIKDGNLSKLKDKSETSTSNLKAQITKKLKDE